MCSDELAFIVGMTRVCFLFCSGLKFIHTTEFNVQQKSYSSWSDESTEKLFSGKVSRRGKVTIHN